MPGRLRPRWSSLARMRCGLSLVVLALGTIDARSQERASDLSAPPRQEQPHRSSTPLSPRNANYTITARLDPRSRTLSGSEVIVWRNISGRSTDELQFHLYSNAWRDTRSTFLRE